MNERTGVGRRRVLTMIAGAALLGPALAGCSNDEPAKLIAGGRTQDPDTKVRWSAVEAAQALVSLHTATAERHPGLADAIDPLTENHRQHLEALRADGPLPTLVRPDSGSTPDVPGDPRAALDAVREAERGASEGHVADCLLAAGPRLAALLASIAAAEAVHDAVLGDA